MTANPVTTRTPSLFAELFDQGRLVLTLATSRAATYLFGLVALRSAAQISDSAVGQLSVASQTAQVALMLGVGLFLGMEVLGASIASSGNWDRLSSLLSGALLAAFAIGVAVAMVIASVLIGILFLSNSPVFSQRGVQLMAVGVLCLALPFQYISLVFGYYFEATARAKHTVTAGFLALTVLLTLSIIASHFSNGPIRDQLLIILACVISARIAQALALLWFAHNDDRVVISVNFRQLSECGDLFRIGIPQTASDFVTTMSVAFIAWTVAHKAQGLLTAYAVGMSYLGAMMLLGTSVSSAAIIRYAGASKTGKAVIQRANIIILAGFMGVQISAQCIWPGFWSRVIAVSAESWPVAAGYQWWALGICGIELVSLAVIGMLRAENDVLVPATVKALVYLTVGAGLTFALLEPSRSFPPLGGLAVAALITTGFFIFRFRRLISASRMRVS